MTSANVVVADLATKINDEHFNATKYAEKAIEHVRRAGELLIEAKAQIEHGQWIPWIRDNLEIGERQVQKYMRVATECTALVNTSSSSYLLDGGINGALASIAKPSTKKTSTKAAITDEQRKVAAQVREAHSQPALRESRNPCNEVVDVHDGSAALEGSCSTKADDVVDDGVRDDVVKIPLEDAISYLVRYADITAQARTVSKALVELVELCGQVVIDRDWMQKTYGSSDEHFEKATDIAAWAVEHWRHHANEDDVERVFGRHRQHAQEGAARRTRRREA